MLDLWHMEVFERISFLLRGLAGVRRVKKNTKNRGHARWTGLSFFFTGMDHNQIRPPVRERHSHSSGTALCPIFIGQQSSPRAAAGQ